MASGWLDLGHPHETDGDFFRSHGVSQENAPAYGEMHPLDSGARLRNAPSVDDAKWGLPSPASGGGMSMPGWMNKKNAKLAGMGLVAGAAVGMVIVPFLSNKKIISKSKSWHAAAVGAAVATPLVASYA
jgi:hypothetical protein